MNPQTQTAIDKMREDKSKLAVHTPIMYDECDIKPSGPDNCIFILMVKSKTKQEPNHIYTFEMPNEQVKALLQALP